LLGPSANRGAEQIQEDEMATLDIIEAIRILRKLGQRIEELDWRGTFDEEPVDVRLFHYSLVTNQVCIKTEFTVDGASHTLEASYALTDQESDEIRFDGREVEEDDVRFDLDLHFFYAKLEYWFSFAEQSGDLHQLYLDAKVPWFELKA
jgi:hypothetical protein